MRSILALATAVAASMQAPSQYARQRVARSAAPLVTEKITYTTVGAYGAQVLQPQLLTLGCKSAPLIGAGQWWRLATPMLLHASPAHLVVNMISLRNVGRSLERAYGAKKTLVVYVASGTGQDKRAKFPTSKPHISAVFHSFWLIFGRAIISRNGLEAWMLFLERARAEHSR